MCGNATLNSEVFTPAIDHVVRLRAVCGIALRAFDVAFRRSIGVS
jgi:hypothetical protein